MVPKFAAFLAVIALSAADKPVSSVNFSSGDDSEIEFSNSVDRKDTVSFGFDSSSRNNELPAEASPFLRNFKSLHNETDLQALASENLNQGSSIDQQDNGPVERSDNSPPVHHRGDIGLPEIAHPLFTPYKHNKIDTADFSDCALQGEWQPIGAPSNHHYTQHEDKQKEHFHAAIEDQDVFNSHNSHSAPTSIDAEGVAFWNQFMKDSTGKGNLFNHHQKQKHPHKQNHNVHHQTHHQHRHHQPPKPVKKVPEALPQKQSFNDFDVFHNIRHPTADVNVLKIQQKPAHDSFSTAQRPSLDDFEFEVLNKNPKESSLSPENVKLFDDFLSPPPVPQRKPHNPKVIEKHRPFYHPAKYHQKPQKVQHSIKVPLKPPPPVLEQHQDGLHSNSYAPQNLIQHQDHHNSPQHQDLHNHHNSPQHQDLHNHHNSPQHQDFHNHHNSPQHQDFHSSHYSPQHLKHQNIHYTAHNKEISKHPNLEHSGHHNQQHQNIHKNTHQSLHSIQHQNNPHNNINSDSSTFTCGHNHAHGTNYHTASYQVEGEADPSFLEEETRGGVSSSGNDHYDAPIIVGHPAFEHNFDEDSNGIHSERFPKQNHPLLDLEHEGTETGGHANRDGKVSDSELESIKAFSENQPLRIGSIETATQDGIPDTTAPQTFHSEIHPSKLYHRDNVEEPNEHSPAFGYKFDHSAFSEVDIGTFGSPSLQKNNPLNAPSTPDIVSEFYPNHDSRKHQNNKGVAPSQSESGGFFGSFFTAPFLEGNVHPEKPPPLPPVPAQTHLEKSPFAQSFSEFSFNDFYKKPKDKYQKASVVVFDHPPPHNKTKNHLPSPPARKRPHKHYEVNENSGEMIPLSAYFPPKKNPRQFNNRTPNFAVSKGKRPKSGSPPAPKYQSTVHFDGSNLDVYQSSPKNKVTKIKLKPKRTRAGPRYSDADLKRSLTIMSRIN